MKHYEHMMDIETRMMEAAKEAALLDVITDHLKEIAAQLPEEKLPNGMSPEQAAESILRTAECYTGTMKKQKTDGGLTSEQFRQLIFRDLESLNTEQVVEYLAYLQLVYNHYNPGQTAVTEESLRMEYEQIRGSMMDISPQEQVENLMEGFSVEQGQRLLKLLGDQQLLQDIQKGDAIDGIINQIRAEYISCERAAIRGAAIYGEAALGRLEEFSPETDPGMVTAQAAASSDAEAVAIWVEQGQVSEEEAQQFLSWIGIALAVAIAMALLAFMLYGDILVGATVAVVLAEVGASLEIAALLGVLVILYRSYLSFSSFGGYYDTAKCLLLGIKKQWKKLCARVSGVREKLAQRTTELA